MTVWETLRSARLFREPVAQLARSSVLASFPKIEGETQHGEIDWNRALFGASVVSAQAPEDVHDGALRIAQGCLQSEDTSAAQRDAATVVLSKLGNARAIKLAIDKSLVVSGHRDRLPIPLQIDAMRRRLELEITTADGGIISVNPFQAKFWQSVGHPGWLSVSAPTSVGKSFIIRHWLEEQLATRTEFTAVLIVPTRALIEEVSADLRREIPQADVFTLPWDERIGQSKRRLLVFTQERLHILELMDPKFSPDVVFVDEAQKIGDGSRGVLLQRVLDVIHRRREDLKVILASPLTSNPELLLAGAPSSSTTLSSELVTVNQNLIHVNQVWGKPLRWETSVLLAGQPTQVGVFTLLARAETQGKRLPLVAATLGGATAGNVVYANTAAEAEKFGEVIFDALGETADMSDDPAIADLIELVENTIHRSYRLRKQLQRGVAFHYGNMPLLVREAIETLFREEKLRYLVCTSTLLEGVNLPCKNLYVRAPRRGTGNPMTAGDFWNLAGRAGRWGIEFQGNIVCVDTTKASTWVNVPTRRERQPITRATDKALTSMEEFLNYIAAGTPLSIAKENRSFEPTYSYIASWIARGKPLSELSWLAEIDDLPRLTKAVEQSLGPVTLSVDSRTRHAGISPLSMQRLADHLRADPDLSKYVIPLPESDQFVATIRRILPMIDTFLGGKFGAHEGRHFQLAILISRWVQGQPLSYLISDRVNYFRNSGRNDSTPNVIRSVMADIEEMVRFQAPLYLACFRDVLQEVRASDAEDPEFDLTMMLELGVSRHTELSMISLGLSRTSVIALSELITAENLTSAECIAWLRNTDISSLDLPRLVIRELTECLATQAGPSDDDSGPTG